VVECVATVYPLLAHCFLVVTVHEDFPHTAAHG
jgi:hypothetical protein